MLARYCSTTLLLTALNLSIGWQAIAQSNDSLKKTTQVNTDFVYKPSIHTVRLYTEGDELGSPIVSLGASDKLILSFDELGEDVQNYNYTLVLCNANWTVNELTPFDYLGGFSEGNITDYKLSSGTKTNYVHYTLAVPNADVYPTKSGNYLIKVYANDDNKAPIFIKRVYVLDNKVNINAIVKTPGASQYASTDQEVQFTLFTKGLAVNNPFDEISTTVMQNLRSDNAYLGLKPQYVKEDSLIYRNDSKIIFPGVKEFRAFDSRNLLYLTNRVKEYMAEINTAVLFPDEIRSYKNYEYVKDANGNYIIGKVDAQDNETQADYVNVHFQLATNAVFPNAGIYIFGAFTNWQLRNEFKLEYNTKNHAYEKDVFLKQGFYNYLYAYTRADSKEVDANLFEGSSAETENDYQILVYYRPIGNKYDQLIGMKLINSFKK